jgi:integrase
MAGSAKKLPSGNWRVNLFLGRDENGKQLFKSFTAPTRKEAEYKAAEFSLTHKEKAKPQAMTVGEAIDRYIDSKTAVLSPSTIVGYKELRKNKLQGLMKIKLEQLTQEAVQKAINKDAQHLSPKSVANAHGLLASALKEYAPDFNLTTRLPAKIKPDISIPEHDELKGLLDRAKARDKEIYCAVILAAYLGLRRSEICALQASDVDGNEITINKAVVVGADNEWNTKAPKSYAGKRTLQAPKAVLEAIAALEVKQGNLFQCTPAAITARYNHLKPPCRFHDLRHYYASVMLALGIPDKYAMERMGHATPNMLKAVYQHTMKDKREEVADTINAFFDT